MQINNICRFSRRLRKKSTVVAGFSKETGVLLIPGTGNGERGTGNGEPGTGVWERVYSGNPYENSK